jgi:hypothetical protein
MAGPKNRMTAADLLLVFFRRLPPFWLITRQYPGRSCAHTSARMPKVTRAEIIVNTNTQLAKTENANRRIRCDPQPLWCADLNMAESLFHFSMWLRWFYLWRR